MFVKIFKHAFNQILEDFLRNINNNYDNINNKYLFVKKFARKPIIIG